MGSNNLFAGMPSINIPRSRWINGHNITGTFKHGYLVPVDFIPILPGDSVSVKIKDLTRMQTPLTAFYGNIKQSFACFFVPYRLVWNHFEEWMGANKTSAGYQTGSYVFPHAKFDRCEVGSLSHYLGKPLKVYADTDADGKQYYAANLVKERAYCLIWNEYFRAQQVTNPIIVDFSDATDSNFAQAKVGTWNGNAIYPGLAVASNNFIPGLMKVAKQFDYFTACTISPQYGAAVELPLGTKAPVYADSASIPSTLTGTPIKYQSGSPSLSNQAYSLGVSANGNNTGVLDSNYDSGSGVYPVNLWTDLSSAAAAKINDIRYAAAVQKYLERSNFAGNTLFGILQVHYGTTSPDSRLQRPEFLGEFTEDILVHQVLSTADTTNNNIKTPVGNVGAMSATASGLVSIANKAFVEPGLLCIVRWCRHRQVYSQGVLREDFIKDRFQMYTPELCNLGDQSTLKRELYWKAGETAIFGAQEHWAELRFRFDRVTGMLDPNGGTGSQPYWTLAHQFTSTPSLNNDFLFESREDIDRALTTGSALDEYIFDTWLDITWTREMPVRTMPGLIDHFGAF